MRGLIKLEYLKNISFSLKNIMQLSLFQIKIKRKIFYFFPLLSIIYLFFIILILFFSLLFIEKKIIPACERSKMLNTDIWVLEDSRINMNNKSKINLDDSYIWSSKSFHYELNNKKLKRILVIGDSFVWGNGYANMNDIWWRQLQWELYKNGYNDIDVLAVGKNGANTRWELEKAKIAFKKCNPDLIIWGYVFNDPDEGLAEQKISTKKYKSDPLILLIKSINKHFPSLSSLFPRLSWILTVKRIDKLGTKYIYFDNYELRILKGINFEKYKTTVKELKKFIDSTQVPNFFITLPNSPDREHFEILYKPVKDLFEYNKITFYDILPEFVDKYKNSGVKLLWGINPANGHPSLRATSYYAKKALEFIEKNYPEVLPKKTSSYSNPDFLINDWVPITMSLKQEKNKITLFFPDNKDESLLRLPYNRNYVQLSFSYPVKLKSINIKGDSLKNAQIILTHYNPENTTDIFLNQQKGTNINWVIDKNDNKLIKEIKLMADFKSDDRQLEIILE